MDRFETHATNLTAPATDGAAVIPGPGPLAHVSRAIWVGGAGSVALELAGGTVVTLAGVPAGTLLPVRARAVLSAGTDASGIVALW